MEDLAYFDVGYYFLQSSQWAKAWKEANGNGHNIFHIESNFEAKSVKYRLECWIFLYPYYFGQNFLYIPKGPVISTFLENDSVIFNQKNLPQDVKKYLWDSFFKQLNQYVFSAKPVFLKWEPSFLSDIFDNLNEASNKNLSDNLANHSNQNSIENPNKNLKLNLNAKFVYNKAKRIQFLGTIILPLLDILRPNLPDYSNDSLSKFYFQNQTFWKKRSNNVWRYTKKSLNLGWQISTIKSEENFESFWKIHKSTSQAQGFFTYPKKYYKSVFLNKSSRIIILFDEQKNPQSVWFGWKSVNSLIYLYGGNLEKSRKQNGQYLVHLAAIFIASLENLFYYDLGGYHANEGYSAFKQKYHGEEIIWQNPKDFVYKPLVYFTFLYAKIFLDWVKNIKK